MNLIRLKHSIDTKHVHLKSNYTLSDNNFKDCYLFIQVIIFNNTSYNTTNSLYIVYCDNI